MDRFDPDRPEAIVFPGWGVPGELYWNSLEESSFASAEIFDYGFFEDEESPMKTPLFDEEIPPVIVGHSMGALFAVRLALQNLGAVHRLILINPFPKFIRDDTFPCGWEPAAVESMRSGLRNRPQTVLKSFLRMCAMPDKYPGILPERLNPQALDDGLKLIEETDLRQVLPLLTDIPVIVLDADADRIVNTEMSRTLAERCLAVHHTFHGWGHFMMLEHPLECTEKLRELAVL